MLTFEVVFLLISENKYFQQSSNSPLPSSHDGRPDYLLQSTGKSCMQTASHSALAASLFCSYCTSERHRCSQSSHAFLLGDLMTLTVTAAEVGAGNLNGREVVGLKRKV